MLSTTALREVFGICTPVRAISQVFSRRCRSARSSKDIDRYTALFVQHRRILPSRVPSLRDVKKVRDPVNLTTLLF